MSTTETATCTTTEIPAALAQALDYYAATNTAPISDARRSRLAEAVDLGAPADVLRLLCDAVRVSRSKTVVLPPERYESLSRGRGWARKGKGDGAEWGERVDSGYRVGPGRWTVGATDGFSRKSSTPWTVKHVQVGPETWTIAN